MAVETEYSTEYTQGHITANADKLDTSEMHGRVRMAFFTHDQATAGDATSIITLAKLPPGRVRLLASQSKAYVNWTTASATLDMGWAAHVDEDGDAVAADVDGIEDGLSVETAGYQTFGGALTATGGTKVFNSREGVDITVSSTDTAIALGDDIVGYLLYVVD